MKRKAVKPASRKKAESSSAFFERLRPRFLDWTPPTEEERQREVKARRDERDAQLKRVTELEKARQAEKAASKKTKK